MSRSRGRWLVAYDVASPRRLARVHRLLVRRGLPTQYSVFLVDADRRGIERLLAELVRRVHSGQDDVRIFRLDPGFARSLGRASLPRGVLAGTGDPAALLRRPAGGPRP